MQLCDETKQHFRRKRLIVTEANISKLFVQKKEPTLLRHADIEKEVRRWPFLGIIPSEIERDRHWYAQGRAFIKAHPGYYLRLVGERFARLWYFFRPDYNIWFMIVMPFSILGLRRYWHLDNFAYLSSFIACSTLVFSAILYGSTRFRLPLEPLFIVFAAAYLSEATQRWDKRRLGRVLGTVIGGNLIVWWQQEPLRQLALSTLNYLNLR